MEYLGIFAIALAALLAAGCFMLFMTREKALKKAAALELQLATSATVIEEAPRLREQLNLALETKTSAITSLREAEKQLTAMKDERDAAVREKMLALDTRSHFEKQAALAQQQVAEAEKRMQDWEKAQKEFTDMAKASVLEAGTVMNKKLLDDHKRESEEARKQVDELTKKNSEEVLNNLSKLIQSVNVTTEQNQRQEGRLDTLWRAMAAPASAGALAEVGLENTLKNLGLESPRDFIMQYTIKSGEGGLRPDAVVFLPQDMVMVIDSKASKHVLEVAQAENGEQEAETLARLKKSMNDHLNALKSKDYAASIQQLYRESGNQGKISITLMVMYIPTEAALEQLKKVDAEFLTKCEKAGVIPVTPSSLFGVLSLASKSIGLMRQSENHEKIIHEVELLIQHCITALGYAESMGRSIESSMNHYTKFAGSVNSRLLGKLRRINQLGVQLPKNKSLPAPLKNFEVQTTSTIIEGEAEYIEESALPKLVKDRTVDA